MAEEKKQDDELSDDELEQAVGGRGAPAAGKPIKGQTIRSPFPSDDLRPETSVTPSWSAEGTQEPPRGGITK